MGRGPRTSRRLEGPGGGSAGEDDTVRGGGSKARAALRHRDRRRLFDQFAGGAVEGGQRAVGSRCRADNVAGGGRVDGLVWPGSADRDACALDQGGVGDAGAAACDGQRSAKGQRTEVGDGGDDVDPVHVQVNSRPVGHRDARARGCFHSDALATGGVVLHDVLLLDGRNHQFAGRGQGDIGGYIEDQGSRDLKGRAQQIRQADGQVGIGSKDWVTETGDGLLNGRADVGVGRIAPGVRLFPAANQLKFEARKSACHGLLHLSGYFDPGH